MRYGLGMDFGFWSILGNSSFHELNIKINGSKKYKMFYFLINIRLNVLCAICSDFLLQWFGQWFMVLVSHMSCSTILWYQYGSAYALYRTIVLSACLSGKFCWIWPLIDATYLHGQTLSRPLLVLSIATAFSDQPGRCNITSDAVEDSQGVNYSQASSESNSELPSAQSTLDMRYKETRRI